MRSSSWRSHDGKEPLSRYGQISNDIEVERQPGDWIDAMVEDKRAGAAVQVAAKATDPLGNTSKKEVLTLREFARMTTSRSSVADQ